MISQRKQLADSAINNEFVEVVSIFRQLTSLIKLPVLWKCGHIELHNGNES